MNTIATVIPVIRAVPLMTLLLLAGCGAPDAPPSVASDGAPRKFWNELTALCGKAFQGHITSNEGGGAAPDPFEGQALIMHARECSSTAIHVPFHVGDDRSRTWVFTRVGDAIQFKHDHRHEDGSSDAVTMYGGDSIESGSASKLSFPADAESKAMFEREGLTPSIDNTWLVDIVPGERLSYALVRPGREFRIDFDITRPVDTPPAPWGH
ncbi:hypothetical protein [Povalibacter sp.]|uniref:hypothetical protein n=1 Tax=Povalibacter sp. TaxID=1962978 RepID=UPI002F4015A4